MQIAGDERKIFLNNKESESLHEDRPMDKKV